MGVRFPRKVFSTFSNAASRVIRRLYVDSKHGVHIMEKAPHCNYCGSDSLHVYTEDGNYREYIRHDEKTGKIHCGSLLFVDEINPLEDNTQVLIGGQARCGECNHSLEKKDIKFLP
jgi:hypothetical protein